MTLMYISYQYRDMSLEEKQTFTDNSSLILVHVYISEHACLRDIYHILYNILGNHFF